MFTVQSWQSLKNCQAEKTDGNTCNRFSSIASSSWNFILLLDFLHESQCQVLDSSHKKVLPFSQKEASKQHKWLTFLNVCERMLFFDSFGIYNFFFLSKAIFKVCDAILNPLLWAFIYMKTSSLLKCLFQGCLRDSNRVLMTELCK